MIEIDDRDLDARLAKDTMMFLGCPAGHYFSGPLESLTCDGEDKHGPGNAVTSRSARDSVRDSHDGDGRDGVGGIAVRDLPAEPEPEISRPNTAPAYYLGHPARLWLTVMSPRRRPRPGNIAYRPLVTQSPIPHAPAQCTRGRAKI